MMRAVYINLDRSTDRRAWMEAQASNLGISLERFPAVDGSTLASNPFPNVPIGAAGCFLSHRALWSEIAKGNDPYVLVLEDDAHLSPDLPLFLSDTSWIPKDADIIHAERTQKYVMVTGRAHRVLGRRIVKVTGGDTGGASYILSRECADELAKSLATIDVEFDQILFNHQRNELTVYKLLPAISVQDKFTSAPIFDLMIKREDQRNQAEARPSIGGILSRETRRLGRKIWSLTPAGERPARVDFR